MNRHLAARRPHRNPNVPGGQCRRIIYTVTDHGDDPNLQYVHVVSAAMRSSMSYSQHPDKKIDDLFERQKRAIDPAERKILTREFEQYSISQAYNIMLFWWQRIVVHNKRVKGWQLTPSHYLGNDLTTVWLDQ